MNFLTWKTFFRFLRLITLSTLHHELPTLTHMSAVLICVLCCRCSCIYKTLPFQCFNNSNNVSAMSVWESHDILWFKCGVCCPFVFTLSSLSLYFSTMNVLVAYLIVQGIPTQEHPITKELVRSLISYIPGLMWGIEGWGFKHHSCA